MNLTIRQLEEGRTVDDHVNAKKGKRRGLWWKVPIGLLVLLVAALTVVLLNIDAIARSQINKALNRYLVAGGDVASVQVRLFEGKVVLEGLRLHPPPGYGEQVPLSWKGLTVDLAPLSLLTGKIVLDGGPLTYRDEMIAAEPIVARLGDVQLTVNDLRLFSDATAAGPAAVSLAFELAQPSNLPTAYLGTLARIGPLGAGIPMVNAQARLVGLKLDTLGSLVPPATRTALGATGLDAAISLVMAADGIDLNAEALTDRGIHYNGLRIHGAPGALSIEPGTPATAV